MTKTLVLGLGGSSCSGKSTLTCLLAKSILQCDIINQDNFFVTDSAIPIGIDGIRNWDQPEALDMDLFKKRLNDLIGNATFGNLEGQNRNGNESNDPISLNSVALEQIEHMPVDENLKSRVNKELLQIVQEAFRSKYRLLIVDGFLLFHDKELYEKFDVRVLLFADKEICRQRRNARSGYNTIEGYWVDPPNYFDQVVWPSYQKYHSEVDKIDSLHKIDTSNQSLTEGHSEMVSEELDWKCINTIRTLAADVVQKANSGHPGAPMGCAPMAHVLFSKFMSFNPKNPKWINRDRFVLSNGHGCVLQYIMLHLLGYPDMTMEELKRFRQLDSRTPGHPECHMTSGIEVTTGPLGQGVSNAVGLAMAEAHLAETFNRPGFQVIDNYTYVIVGDGCLQEGISSEACSLAGHLGLGNLIVLYDDNNITIDGETEVSFTEDVIKRFEAYGFHTQVVTDGDSNINSIINAINNAKSVHDKPSFIKIRTTIGFGSKAQGTEKVHGSPLGPEDVAVAKTNLGFDPQKFFFIPAEVSQFYEQVSGKGAGIEAKWNELFSSYSATHPELAKELRRRINGEFPANWKSVFPRYTPSDPAVATRKLSETVLNKICESLPEIVGGSADLTGSNLTKWKGSVDFQKHNSKLGNYSGRYIRFGVREHGMSAILNGLSAYGAIIPFGATFLNFITYAWGAVRLSALSHLRVIYIMTHDSIGLGEDGPTHQPVETLAALRALPNIITFRPADGNEVSGSYIIALENSKRPSVLCLTRQNLPHLENSSPEKVAYGAYVAKDCENPSIALVASGSEVSLALESAQVLAEKGINARVISMPSCELFNEQSLEYKESVFPPNIPSLSIEAMSTFGWRKYAHVSVGLDTFGASAPYKEVYKKIGLTPTIIAEKAKRTVEFFKSTPLTPLFKSPF